MESSKLNLPKTAKNLEKYMTEKRLWHTLGVMHTAAAMAMVYDISIEQAQIAGLLHDCAKCISPKKTIKLCAEHDIPVTGFESENPYLLHGKLGAWIAENKYGIEDPEILSAITWHTTGKEDMSTLEKIIFIADYIEPSRNVIPGLKEARTLAFQNLDECVYLILKNTLDYLGDGKKAIDETTVRAYDYYKKLLHKEDTI